MQRQKSPPSLRVLTGLNAGATCMLPEGRFSIGSEPPAQILLSDEHVAPQHVVVERDEDGLRLSVEAAGVRIEGADLSAVLPITLSIGGVDIRCENSIAAKPQAWRFAWLSARIRPSALGAGAAAGAALLAGIALLPISTKAFVPPRDAPPHSGRQDPAVPSPEARATPVNDAMLRSETQEQLQARNLPGLSIDVSSGVVTIHGQLDPASASRLHDVELWFDHRFGEQAVFMSQVSPQAARKFSIPLDAVWNGPEPNVVVRGQRYYVGSSLPGGASIDQITLHQVRVSQNGQHYAVDY